MENESDPLAPAKGCLNAVLITLAIILFLAFLFGLGNEKWNGVLTLYGYCTTIAV